MIWCSFKDKRGVVQSFDVDKYQEETLHFMESTLKAIPLEANTPVKGRVSVCYRFINGIEIGILLNDSAPTFYLNEKVVNKYLMGDSDFNVLIQDIKLFEKGGHIYPHSIYNLPNTTVLRPSLKTLYPTADNKVFVISQLDYRLVIKLLHLISV